MNKILAIGLLLLMGIFNKPLYAQAIDDFPGKRRFTLEEIIQYAHDQSLSALQAKTRRKNRYWQFRTYKSNYKPQLSLNGTFPNFTRIYRRVVLEDGNIIYQKVVDNSAELNLRLSQSIGATGGEIYVNSSLERTDNFEKDFTQYVGNPFILGFSQPLFAFNELKWDKKIEPLRYEESQREYVEDLQAISVRCTELFFDLLLAQVNLEIALKNLNSNDTIYRIGEGRYDLGKIAKNDLLQLELNILKSRQDVSKANVDLETSTLRLKTFIGFTGNEEIELVLPGDIPDIEVSESVAIQEAKKNRSDVVSFKRQMLQAERDVAQAKGANGLNMEMYGTIGLTNSGNEFTNIYEDPDDQQTIAIGFNIPIIDWGRSKSRIQTASANQELIQYTVSQDEINFEQEVATQVKQLMMLKDQLVITKKTDEISENRYEISKNRYLIGKISITDLNIALQDKDLAKRGYISSLRSFWVALYELKNLTLYDFIHQRNLLLEEEGME